MSAMVRKSRWKFPVFAAQWRVRQMPAVPPAFWKLPAPSSNKGRTTVHAATGRVYGGRICLMTNDAPQAQ